MLLVLVATLTIAAFGLLAIVLSAAQRRHPSRTNSDARDDGAWVWASSDSGSDAGGLSDSCGDTGGGDAGGGGDGGGGCD